MARNAMEEMWSVCEFTDSDGNVHAGLFCDMRIDRSTVPEGWYCYEIRHDDDCQGDWAEIGASILVNFWGTLLTAEQLLTPSQDFMEVSDYGYMDHSTYLSDVIGLKVRFFISGEERYCVISDSFHHFGCVFLSAGQSYGQCVYVPGTDRFLETIDSAMDSGSQDKLDEIMGLIAALLEGSSESGDDVISGHFEENVPACCHYLKKQILEYLNPLYTEDGMHVIKRNLWKGGSIGVQS